MVILTSSTVNVDLSEVGEWIHPFAAQTSHSTRSQFPRQPNKTRLSPHFIPRHEPEVIGYASTAVLCLASRPVSIFTRRANLIQMGPPRLPQTGLRVDG
jgi:hypothetical protein